MINNYLNEHTIPAIISLLYCILLYLDTKIYNSERSTRDYIKAFMVMYTLSYFSIYLYTTYALNMSINKLSPSKNILREEIFVGNPDF